MNDFTQEKLLGLRDKNEDWLQSQPGVVGTGVGMGKGGDICLKVFTDHMPAATRNAIYEHLAEIPVEFEEVGEVRKQAR